MKINHICHKINLFGKTHSPYPKIHDFWISMAPTPKLISGLLIKNYGFQPSSSPTAGNWVKNNSTSSSS